MNANSSSVAVMATHPEIGPLYWLYVHDAYAGHSYSLTTDLEDEDLLTLPSKWREMGGLGSFASFPSRVIECNSTEVCVPSSLPEDEDEGYGEITRTVPCRVFGWLVKGTDVTAQQLYDWFLTANWQDVAFARNA